MMYGKNDYLLRTGIRDLRSHRGVEYMEYTSWKLTDEQNYDPRRFCHYTSCKEKGYYCLGEKCSHRSNAITKEGQSIVLIGLGISLFMEF